MKSILITGGTGSLGNALVEVLDGLAEVSRIVVYSRDEWKQAQMAERFPPFGKVRYMLGDVRDPERLRQAMVGIDTVIHAAALKRVDSTSYNPTEIVKTNVVGTMNVIDAAAGKADRVLAISSDKAVEPTNIYGASKMMAEHFAVNSNSFCYPQKTMVSVARYGNVLGSRGSLVHVFKKALAENQPLPVTDPNCTRFSITLKNAAYFVLSSIHTMRGGEIFIPKLKSVRLSDFAAAMSDKWEVVGLRPGGEKLHETLVSKGEAHRTAKISDLRYTILPERTPWTNQPRTLVCNFDRAEFNSNENEFYSVDDIRRILIEEGYVDSAA